MNQKGFVNIIIIVIAVVLIGAGAYFVLNRQIQLNPPMPTPTPEAPKSGPITVTGEITCLSKKGAGEQTLECAIGLKGLDGRYYGLPNLHEHDPEYKFTNAVGVQVSVSGVFNPKEILGPDGNKYDVVGTIDVTSIKEISNSPSSKLHPRLKELTEQGLPNDSIEVIINLRETASRACKEVSGN